MACNIIRNQNGKIVNVTADNGNNSKLFKDIVKLGYDKETAVKKWALTYTPTFKQWFGEGVVDSNNEPKITMVNNQPVFTADDNTIKHATENLGTFISKKDPSPLLNSIQERFKLVNPDGSVRNIPNSVNIYRIQETIEKQYPGVKAFILQDIGGDFIKLSVTPNLDVDNIMHQVEAAQVAARDEAVDRAMMKFFKSLGVDLKSVEDIRDKNGNKLDVAAKLDLTNKIVSYAKGKIGLDTLPEEAAHLMVRLLKVENSPLFQAMMNNITSFEEYKRVVENETYQNLYKGDIALLKEEAIGKVVAKHIIKNIKQEKLKTLIFLQIVCFIILRILKDKNIVITSFKKLQRTVERENFSQLINAV